MHRVALITLILILLSACYLAGAEDRTMYILCDPKTENHVAIRRSPRKTAEETGRLECGDYVITDGKTKNGYLHVLGVTEYGEGWVFKGYVVDDPPVIERCNASITASGRVMARRYIGGKRAGWLKVCDEVKVYAMSEEWSVTSRGYIRTKYLEVWHE